MSSRGLIIRTAILLLFFLGVLILSVSYGPGKRRFAAPPVIRSVTNYVDIYHLWEQERIKGRILFLFDRHAFRADKGAEATDDNYLDLAVRKGIVRHVYHIVPKSAWQEVQLNLRKDTRFQFASGVFILPMEEGRLYVTTLDGIRAMQEQVLVIVNKEVWTPGELEQITRLLQVGSLKSDLAVFR